MINYDREKLINAIIYFLKKTKYCGKTKLLKLLYFLDFEHFKQTGKSVTGLEYFTWKFGPVPQKLYKELENPSGDLSENFIIQKPDIADIDDEFQIFKIKSRKKFNDKHFSEREIDILQKIAEIYKDARAKDMTEITHLKNAPWRKTLKEKGELAKIDYMLAIDNSSESLKKEIIEERINEMEEMKRVFD